MKDLKDYSIELESLDIVLAESILDDDMVDSLDKMASTDWLKKYTTGNYKVKKTGYSLKITGDLIIDGFDGETIPVTIFNIKGSLSIVNCPKLKSIKGLIEFSIDGGLHIENCPELETLEGCPKVIGNDFTCIGNRKIKSLAGCPECVFGDVHIMKNGKKFSEEYIKTLIKDYESINCSEDSNELVINEALTEPHLLKFAQQLNDQRKEGVHTKRFADIFPTYTGIQYDKVTSKDVKVFKSFEYEAMLKECRAYIADKKFGVILLQDKDGKYWGVIFKKNIYIINRYGLSARQYNRVQSTELLSYCKEAHKVIAIDLSKFENYNLKNDRRASREGMVIYDEAYNEKVAKDNIARYKAILVKRRALSNINFDDIDDQVQEVMTKVLMASRIVHKNPAKYADYTYKISHLNSLVYDQMRYEKGKAWGRDGLLKLYDRLTDYFLETQKDKGNGLSEYYAKKIDPVKAEITSLIKIIKAELSYFGL